MPILSHELADLRARIARALEGSQLSVWQRQFLTDMADRLARFGAKARLSDKQEAILRKLVALPGSPGAVPHSFAPRPAYPKADRSRPYRRRPYSLRAAYREMKAGAALLLFAAMGLSALIGGQSPGQTAADAPASLVRLSAADFSVTDGDTIRLSGEQHGTRLVGFNTPETFEPQCSAERNLGTQATERLKDLVASATRVECTRGDHTRRYGKYMAVPNACTNRPLISGRQCAPKTA